MRALRHILALVMVLTLLAGCYPMPGEDDFSIVPTTNNPDITREKTSALPNMSY